MTFTPAPVADPVRASRVVHAALIGGLVVVCVVFGLLTYAAHAAPLLPPGNGATMMGYVLAGCGVAAMVLAFVIAKPRIPERRSGQHEAAYWQEAIYPAIAFWAVFEGAGIVGAIGALLTGLLAPALVVVLAVVGLVAFGPGNFENR
jgi:hypothetical protein